jgi:hypothetical protein
MNVYRSIFLISGFACIVTYIRIHLHPCPHLHISQWLNNFTGINYVLSLSLSLILFVFIWDFVTVMKIVAHIFWYHLRWNCFRLLCYQ